MKYVLIDQLKDGDMFSDEFATKEEAIKAGEKAFAHLTAYDQKRRSDLYVLESVNPDEDAEDHFDGDEVKRWI